MTPEPPATPAVRAANERETVAIRDLALLIWMMDSPPDAGEYRAAVKAVVDAVAARVTADLLASGTPLIVQTDDGGDVHLQQEVRPGYTRWIANFPRGVLATPPGTVHQAVLLMKPEEA